MTDALVPLGAIVDAIAKFKTFAPHQYGRLGRRVDSPDLLRPTARIPISKHSLQLAHDLAEQLDLDDIGIGHDLLVRQCVDQNQEPVPQGESVSLAPHAYLLVSRRTGLYRPGRSFITKAADQADWTATATALVRDRLDRTDWTEVGVQVLYRNVVEPKEPGDSSTSGWDVDPFTMLLHAAECHVAHKALGSLLDPIPCRWAVDHLAENPAIRQAIQASQVSSHR